MKGPILISGYFEFLQANSDDKLNPQAVILARAMEFALENINSTFRFEAIFNSKKIRKDLKCVNSMSNFSVFGIGPMYPRDLRYLLEADGTFVSYYSPKEHLSDDDDNDSDSVFSVVPRNLFRIRALLDIVRKFKWRYVSVASSYGEHGRIEAEEFIDRIAEANSCVDSHIRLPLKHNRKKFKDFEKINSSALISFTMGQDTVNVIKHLSGKSGKQFQVIFAFGTISYDEIGSNRILSVNANETLFVDFQSMEISKFTNFICQNTCNSSRNRRLRPIWCDGGNRKISLCSGNVPKYNSYLFTPVHLVMKAVRVLANAIEISAKDDIQYYGLKVRQNVVQKHLRNNTECGHTLDSSKSLEDNGKVRYDIISLVTYENNRKYTYKLIKVGSWTSNKSECDAQVTGNLKMNISDIVWMFESRKRDENHPGLTCQQNERQARITGVDTGKCWECLTCGWNEIVYNNTCTLCRRDSKPDKDFSSCIVLPRKTLDVERSWQGKMILALGLSGLFAVFFVAIMFLKYRNSRVVKASGRELSIFILVGISLTFLASITFISPVGNVTCSLRQILPGFAFCLCYAPLFLKVNRIYRIFTNSEKLEKTYMASPRSQVLLVLGIAAIQVIPGCTWILRSVPDTAIEYPDHRDYIVIHCPIDHSGFFLNVALGFIFMFGST